MAHRADRKVELKTWGPEAAGQQIAKLTVEDTEIDTQFDKDVPIVDIAIWVAQISPEGATYGFTERKEEGEVEHIFFPGDISGFIASAGLQVRLHKKKDPELEYVRPVLFAGSSKDAGDVLAPDSTEDDSNKSVTEDSSELLKKLKQELAERKLEAVYPKIYFALNAILGHAAIRAAHTRFGSRRLMQVIGDPAMHETTLQHLEAARDTVLGLVAQESEDRKMMNDFFALCGKELPDRFEQSRLFVASKESALAGRDETDQPPYTYLPIGWRPGGRSWPYMDATEGPERHFGVELAALEDGNGRRVLREVERELSELDSRVEHALEGHDWLTRLAEAEAKANPLQ